MVRWRLAVQRGLLALLCALLASSACSRIGFDLHSEGGASPDGAEIIQRDLGGADGADAGDSGIDVVSNDLSTSPPDGAIDAAGPDSIDDASFPAADATTDAVATMPDGVADGWTGDPPSNVVLAPCPEGTCCIGDGISLNWEPVPGAAYYEIRWLCNTTWRNHISFDASNPDAIGPPIEMGTFCLSTSNWQVCACRTSYECSCTPVPAPVPSSCTNTCCTWP